MNGTSPQSNIGQRWFTGGSTLVGMALIGILLVMLIPLPPSVLDILLSANITYAIIILLVAIYVLKPLDFSVFPSVLLTATLFRLALNVASTRLILLNGHEGTEAAGRVIQAFGTFVVGGNFVVGLIVFLVLVLINFIVITKGATRIAEVAARFTLDAMPGKQMSIDADLNAGLISDTDARNRRKSVERESDFYGAMDGASKFVRGDAVAGIVIVLINIIGGLVVGVLQQGMDVGTAARTYTLLTVGDGLVTQIPALVVSAAAGMLVTRSAASADLGREMSEQILTQPRAIATAAVVLFTFGMIPGMPTFAFIVMSAAMFVLAWNLSRAAAREEEEEQEKEAVAPPPEPADTLLPLDAMELDVGYGLIPMVDAGQDGELLDRIKTFRRQFALDMGFILPAVHIRDNLQLKPGEYVMKIRGAEVARGEVMMDHYLVIAPDENLGVKGIPATEPAFGLPALWVTEKEKELLSSQGVVVVDSATVIMTHITEIVKNHTEELLGRQDVKALLETLSHSHQGLVEELVPSVVPLGTLHKVMQRLLKERVSIRDVATILETLADHVPVTKNVDFLAGYVRQALSRAITNQYKDEKNELEVVLISPDMEEAINRSVQHTEFESYVLAEPSLVQNMVGTLQDYVRTFTERGKQPVILCSPGIRSALWKLLEKFFPFITVLSHSEITHDVQIKSLGMLRLPDAS
ncbi:MAG TPA: flagellar biosynthesis protein FlhA [Deltaproteobacteria bacterium]|nr:flagellar biosynthesis protein FlhA [Deltaproteobacteria bacterium]